MKRCDTCKFWRRRSEKDQHDEGLCHRRAPVPMGIAFDLYDQRASQTSVNLTATIDNRSDAFPCWPTVSEDDWCAEHRPKWWPL